MKKEIKEGVPEEKSLNKDGDKVNSDEARRYDK